MIEKENEWLKSALEQHRKVGNKWNRIYGRYEGLLCFIFLDSGNPFSISPEDYESMTGEDLEVFHRLLKDDYFESIRSAGLAFQRSLDSTKVDIEFRWEGGKVHLDRLSEKELLSCLKPFGTALENLYDKPKFANQPKTWPWPYNPTWIPPNTQQCDLCHETSCDYVKTKIAPEFKPRIKDFGAKGRGLKR